MTADPRIFVSYSSKDRDYAVAQRERIAAQGLTLWQDFANLEGGNAGGWWDQIRERLENRATEHMVLFVSVDSLVSGVVADEWRYARRQGVEVHLIKVPDKLRGQDIAQLPAGMSTQHFYNLETPEQFDRLIAALRGPSRQLKVPMMAPAPDEHFVLRNEEADKLIAALLRNPDAADTKAGSSHGRAVGITAALRGAGGYGKTQLARWLCQQERIVDHFHDGILWVELGENPDQTGGLQGKVEFLIAQLRRTLTDEDRGFPSAMAAARRLFELLEKGSTRGKGRYLLVIDDAWRKSDVELFLGGAPATVRLVTTRIDDTLPIGSDKIPVDAMKPAEAVELLAVGLDRLGVIADDIASNGATFTHLAGRLGEWALLLALANGQLRAEVEAGLPLAEALRFVERIYDDMGLTAFDPQDETQRTRAAALSIGASLGRLSNVEVSRFEDLAIFPEEEHIPTATIARLWTHTSSGEVTEIIGGQLLRKMRRYALLQSLDLGLGTARLHDVMRKYLRDRVGSTGLFARHRAWLAAYAAIDASALSGPEQLYYYRRRPLHLSEAGETEALDALLTDVAWMQQKLSVFASPLPLIEDYRAYAPYDPANKTATALVGRALEQSAGALGRDERQLVPHLLGRLRPDMAGGVDAVLSKARRLAKPPTLLPRVPRMIQADSALIRTIEAPPASKWLCAVAFSPDGKRILSAGFPGVHCLWDAETGRALSEPFKGGTAIALVFSPDGTRIFGADLFQGEVNFFAVGPYVRIEGLYLGSEGRSLHPSFRPDGTPIYCCIVDKKICLRNALTGQLIATTVEFDWSPSGPVAISHDSALIASAHDDNSLRLWDTISGAAIGTPLKGHHERICSLAFSPNGEFLVSGSSDKTIRLWNARTMQAICAPLLGHGGVLAVAFSPDSQRLVTGSFDNTLRIWDVSATYGEHPVAAVNAVAISRSRSLIVSGHEDNLLRLSDAATGAAIKTPLDGHNGSVKAVAFSPNGRHFASGSSDRSLRLWDVNRWEQIGQPIKGHEGDVNTITFSPDSQQIVSGADDKTLRRWDVRTGLPAGEPSAGHNSEVLAVAFSVDGNYFISGGEDNAIRFWSADTGGAIGQPMSEMNPARFSRAFHALAFSPDGGHFVSGSRAGTIRFWNSETRLPVSEALVGHSRKVNAVTYFLQGTLVASCSEDKLLKVWDATTGAELFWFEGDAAFHCLDIADRTLASGDELGRVHLLDIIIDEADKAAWLARFEAPSPAQPPADIASAPPEMQVTTAQLADARHLETYQDRHLFALADGRIYLDGLIAVSSVEHARATLDEMARQDREA